MEKCYTERGTVEEQRGGVKGRHTCINGHKGGVSEWVNITLRPFLHNHGGIVTDGSRDYALLLSNDLKGSLQCTVGLP